MSVLSLVRPRSAVGAELPRFLCVDDVVALIGEEVTSENAIYRELNAGRFPAIRIRSRWAVPSRAVVALERAAQELRTVERSDWDDQWEQQTEGSSRFVKVVVAARLLTTSAATLKREIAAGQFPATKFGCRWMVPAKAIDAMERAALEGWTWVSAADPAFKTTPGQVPAWARPVAVSA